MRCSVAVVVRGRVQGVGFRYFTLDAARNRGLTGTVENRPDDSVAVQADGERDDLERFLEDLRRGPPFARVEAIEMEWNPAPVGFADFCIED